VGVLYPCLILLGHYKKGAVFFISISAFVQTLISPFSYVIRRIATVYLRHLFFSYKIGKNLLKKLHYVQTKHVPRAYLINVKGVRIMFGGCFGFDDCGRRSNRHNVCRSDRRSGRRSFKHDDRRTGNRNRFCNVLRNLSVGTRVTLLTIRDNGTFTNVVFEGFSNGVALFSGGSIPGGGLLRVCPDDVVAIVF